MPQLVLAYFCAKRALVPLEISPVDCSCGEIAWRIQFAAPALADGMVVNRLFGHLPSLISALRDLDPVEVET